MPAKCTIKLTNTSEIYFTGDLITGIVEYKNISPKFFTSIKIRIRGTTVCAFDMNVGMNANGTEFVRQRHHSVEKLIKSDEILRGEGELKPGKYSWPFSFQVDETWPTSMEGKNGHIRYYVSLKIYNKNKYSNIFLKPITVIKRIDLNRRRQELQRKEVLLSATFCCGYIRCGPDIKITKLYRGYAPGQLVTYALDLSSKVPEKQYNLEVKFYRETIFRANEPHLGELVHESIFYHSKPVTTTADDVQHIEETFAIPSTPPTTKTRFITVRYIFNVNLKVKCCPFAFQELIPIEIGTVPLKETLMPRQRQDIVEVRPDEFIMTPRMFRKPRDLDSPFINEKEIRLNRVDDFMPSYPMFPPV